MGNDGAVQRAAQRTNERDQRATVPHPLDEGGTDDDAVGDARHPGGARRR